MARDLKKIDRDQVDRILRRIEDELPEKAETFPVLTGKFSGLRKFRVGNHRAIYVHGFFFWYGATYLENSDCACRCCAD